MSNFIKIRSVEFERTDMMEQIDASRNSANTPKKVLKLNRCRRPGTKY